MNVNDLMDLNVFKLHTNENTMKNEFNGVYCGDLLSMVMANAEEENCFITVQNNINSIAVSVLVEMKVIIFVHNLLPTDEMIKKANEENICLLNSKLDATSIILLMKEHNLL